MKAQGLVHKYGSNVDTDVIIPARYLNTANHKELAAHCMEDIDKEFIHRVKQGDLIVADQGSWGFLRHCKKLCPHFLPQRNQHRPTDSRMP